MMTIVGYHSANKYYKIISIIMMVCCLFFTACSSGNSKPNNSMDYLNSDYVTEILGKSKSEISEMFTDLINADELSKNEYKLTTSFVYNNQDISIKLIFENDILLRVQYDFENKNETALEFSKDMYDKFNTKFGECATYPTMPNRIEKLTYESYKSGNQHSYQEFWKMENGIFDAIIPEKYKDSKRVDIGIIINKKLKGNSEIYTDVLVGGIVNNKD